MTPERHNRVVQASTRDALRVADQLLTERLVELGFVRETRGIYHWPGATADTRGWLGLNQSTSEGVNLFPFVGMRHRGVEAILVRLGASAYSGPLAVVQLGYLMPERAARSWGFGEDPTLDRKSADALVTAVQRFALPFFEFNSDLAALGESVKANSVEDQSAYVLPVIYRLMGQPQLADEALDSDLRDAEGEAGSSYRSFVAHLKRN